MITLPFLLRVHHLLTWKITIILLASTTFCMSQEIKIAFNEGNWFAVVEQARNENKFIFVDVYADYCPPCKTMDREVFSNNEVAIFYNEHFINYKINLSKSNNTYFQEMYTIGELPALMYFTTDGTTVMYQETGCKTILEFLTMGQGVIQSRRSVKDWGQNPNNIRFLELKDRYEREIRLPADVKEYAYLCKEYNEPFNEIVNVYLSMQGNTLRSKENRQFIYDFTFNLENQAVDYFIEDLVYFKEAFGGRDINAKLKTAIYNSVLTATRTGDYALFNKAEDVIPKASLPDEERFTFEMRSLFYQGTNNWNNYAKVAYKYLSVRTPSDAQLLNDVASKFQQHVSNKKMLKAASNWVRKSIKIENEYYNNATYAGLLYKMGKTNKAIKVAQDAIYIANLREEDASETLRFLDRMKSSQRYNR